MKLLEVQSTKEFASTFLNDIFFKMAVNRVLDNAPTVEGVTIQKWIPVTERLPEEWVDVLVWSKCGFCEVAVYLGIRGKWRVSWNHDMLDADTVTHWMPLPEPPNGERRTDGTA